LGRKLLVEIKKAKTGSKQLKSPEGQKFTRNQAAADAGLTPKQAKTAIEVARVQKKLAGVPVLAATPLVPIGSFLHHWDRHWYISAIARRLREQLARPMPGPEPDFRRVAEHRGVFGLADVFLERHGLVADILHFVDPTGLGVGCARGLIAGQRHARQVWAVHRSSPPQSREATRRDRHAASRTVAAIVAAAASASLTRTFRDRPRRDSFRQANQE
jgi:hypothetical protein